MAGGLEFRTAETKEDGEVFSEAAGEARVGKRLQGQPVEGSAGVCDIEGVGREVLGVEGLPTSKEYTLGRDWKEFGLLLILLKQVVQSSQVCPCGTAAPGLH